MMKRVLLPPLATLLLFCTLHVPLMGEESIDVLLKNYRKEADLSNQTKKENAGYVVVYTRDDLERMQIFRLSDIFKELQFLRYNLNNFGMPDPLHVEPFFYSSDAIKLYVNNHEITSGFSGSGLQFYGNVDMGMFDHVEIYYGAPVLDVATEPSAIVIKLYTKSPERENGGNLTLRVGDRGSQEAFMSHARDLGEWSYFVYVEESENNFKHTQNRVTFDIPGIVSIDRAFQVSQDYSQQHLFLDLHRDMHSLELEYLGQKHDPFTAQSLYIAPESGDSQQPMYRVSYSGDFLDDAFHVDLSFIRSELEFDMRSFGPYWGQLLIDTERNDPSVYINDNTFNLHVNGDIFTAKSYYEERIGDVHLVKIGAEYRYKNADLDDYRFNDYRFEDKQADMDIWSIYVQDQIQVRSNAMLSLSLKYNYYDFERKSSNSAEETLSTWQGRVAFSTIFDAWHLKGFLNHVEFPTQLYVLVMHDNKLESQKLDGISGEIKRVGKKNDVRLFLSYSWMHDIQVLGVDDIHRHRLADVERFNASMDYVHRFSDDHRLDINVNWVKFKDDELLSKRFPKDHYFGGYVRLLDTFDSIDLFNELVYHENRGELDAGWDYSAGIIYHVNDDLSFALKGVDIFDGAQEGYYLKRLPGTTMTGMPIPTVGRQFYLSMEWLF
jgi:iron complex outermembrane receptor protein